jgi:lipoyl(octanoyl) transferase
LRVQEDAAVAGASVADPVEWALEPGFLPYAEAVEAMERRAAEIAARVARERVWLVEHPPLLTAGTSARPADLLRPDALPVYVSGRGGQYTYHGPGQRVAYVMLDLRRRGLGLRDYIARLESWIVGTLSAFGVRGERRPDRIGVWVDTPAGESKIAAIGVRVRHGVAFHGVAVNVDPDLSHYEAIVPCGVRGFGVTSLRALGVTATMAEVDAVLRAEFERIFAAGR